MAEAMAIIHLDNTSPYISSDLPGNNSGQANVPLFDLAPDGVYLAANSYLLRGALLPHHFTLTHNKAGGLFSAALAVGLHLPDVIWHPALRSPDFPPSTQGTARLPGRLRRAI